MCDVGEKYKVVILNVWKCFDYVVFFVCVYVFDSVFYGFVSVVYRVIFVFWAYVERFFTSESKFEEVLFICMVFFNFFFGFEYFNSCFEEFVVVGLFDEIFGE